MEKITSFALFMLIQKTVVFWIEVPDNRSQAFQKGGMREK